MLWLLQVERTVYNRLFDGLENPDGCAAKGTFFVSHKHTDYSTVERLQHKGHEIGSFSVSRNEDIKYWNQADELIWANEMDTQRQIAETYGQLPHNEIRGMRTPLLVSGKKSQYTMMITEQFAYDASMVVPLKRVPVWPYSLDYQVSHPCHSQGKACPVNSHPGVWIMPLNEIDRRQMVFDERLNRTVLEAEKDLTQLTGCSLISTCASLTSAAKLRHTLDLNLERFMTTSRAPLSLAFDAQYLETYKELVPALRKWMEDALKTQQVYFVTTTQALQWITEPVRMNELRDFLPWQDKCQAQEGHGTCLKPNSCKGRNRDIETGARVGGIMKTCAKCPDRYPWIGDAGGQEDDDFLDF